MRILSRDELLGTSIADQSTRMQAPLWELRRVMMFNRTTIVIIVSVGEEKTHAIRTRHDAMTPSWEETSVGEYGFSTPPSGCSLPTSRFIILRVRHLSHSIVAKRNAVRVSKWLCARRKQSFAIRACSRLRERRIREGEISEWKNARVNLGRSGKATVIVRGRRTEIKREGVGKAWKRRFESVRKVKEETGSLTIAVEESISDITIKVTCFKVSQTFEEVLASSYKQFAPLWPDIHRIFPVAFEKWTCVFYWIVRSFNRLHYF